jgi:HPt (histidine-containing phosphotransfer) domain-containing protein
LPQLRLAHFSAIKASNIDQALILLHTYKGTAATIGLTALSNLLAEMESRLRAEQKLETVRDQLPRLEALELFAQTEFKQTFEQLTQNQTQPAGAANSGGVDAAKIAAVLQQLQDYLAAEDYEVLNFFTESRDVLMHLPETTFQRLETAIQELDCEGAAAACRNI